jgi:primosomal protein N' (replication factor Y)
MRRFIDWVGRYTLSAPGMVARMVLRVPAAFDPEPPTPGCGAPTHCRNG